MAANTQVLVRFFTCSRHSRGMDPVIGSLPGTDSLDVERTALALAWHGMASRLVVE